jgi:hypothetical protein
VTILMERMREEIVRRNIYCRRLRRASLDFLAIRCRCGSHGMGWQAWPVVTLSN